VNDNVDLEALAASQPPPELADAYSPEQFRLVQLQTYDWGTLKGRLTVPIAEEGYLVVGPSGSGKSTLLDAHAALLTPPKWLAFNVAAREADKSRDRNTMSYVRGAWAQQTTDEGTPAIQYLRSGTTWSALAETYRNSEGRVVVLAAVMWVKGKATAGTELKKRYIIVERPFDLSELAFFPKAEFDVRRFRVDLPDAAVFEEFSAYQERFRRLMQVDNELALRLLHKTQSAKNLGDLNAFLRDFMLDEPGTFKAAERLVSEFGELNEAHQAVLQARLQVETLVPAREDYAALKVVKSESLILAEVKTGLEPYRTQRHKALLEARIAELFVQHEGLTQEALRLGNIARQEEALLDSLHNRRLGQGGGILERLEADIRQAEGARDACHEPRRRAQDACRILGLTFPENPYGFVALAEGCRQSVDREGDDRGAREATRDALKADEGAHARAFKELCREIEAMERHRTSIPADAQHVRMRLCEAEGIAEDKLPYAGELMEVREDCLEWQPALERLLRNSALTLLVEERYYAQVSRYLNQENIGGRLVYLRMIAQPDIVKPLNPKSSVRKLKFAPGPHGVWLRNDLAARSDYLCADSIEEFRASTRGLTISGQIKHSASRHEKDDRHPVNDRSRWVMGFDNAAKLALYQSKAADVAEQLTAVQRRLETLREQGDVAQRKFQANVTLANMRWAEVDIASALDRVKHLQTQLAAEKAKRPDLDELDRQIHEQEPRVKAARETHNKKVSEANGSERDREDAVKDLQDLPTHWLEVELTPTQQQGLDQRFAAINQVVTLGNLESLTRQVNNAIGIEEKAHTNTMWQLQGAIEGRFAEFCRLWPAESDGLDPKLASADDFMAKLGRLESDGLPKFEKKFFELLRDQSDQNLAMLSTGLEHERKAILERLEDVNDSLRTAEFNAGTYLVIEAVERNIEDVRQFKASLRAALDRSFENDPAIMEQRFSTLASIVKRLGSVDAINVQWRAKVLDVRQHVEFVAREMDKAGIEVDVYRSGAGKSGGQRQKLAATCLAAALRYQLSGEDRSSPTYTTVVLDEAFDKADSEFTATAMNIFKTFGFQMLVATPLKSVMTLEPFIGGACFVHIRDRKYSEVVLIEYDKSQKRLNLPGHLSEHAEEALAS